MAKRAIKAEAIDTPVRLALQLTLTHFFGPIYGQVASTLLADTLYHYMSQKGS